MTAPVMYHKYSHAPDVTGLSHGQYELGGLVFGTRSPWLVKNDYLVQSFDTESGTISVGDVPYPNEDGTRFGVDYREGQVLTFDMAVWRRAQPSYDQVSKLQSMWRNPEFRTTPNAVTTLRMNRGGRTRRVYGRPRNFKPTYGNIERGWAPITATFACSDNNFYDDLETSREIGLANPPTAGLVLPTTAPVRITQHSAVYTNITVQGDAPSWPVFRIHGPVTEPTITYDDKWQIKLLISLNHRQDVTIDSRPWYRQTLRNDGANLSGVYTADSVVMRDMAFTPGLHNLVYTGIDPTLTSRITVGWRNAWSTP